MVLDEFLTIDQACRVIGGKERPISRASYYRGVRAGRYPKPIKISAQLSRVSLAELREAMQAIVMAS
jgi:predicted DNA-binding transcriptional regulator AlpA